MIDESPSPEDVRRFGEETTACRACGEEMWDQADVCPSCGAFQSAEGGPSGLARRPWAIVVALAALAAFLLAVLRLW